MQGSVILLGDAISVVESQLRIFVDVLQGKESKSMEWCVGRVGNNGEDAEVGVTRMVDETGRS